MIGTLFCSKIIKMTAVLILFIFILKNVNLQALEIQILEFGQIPKQLFTTPHVVKLLKIRKELNSSNKLCEKIEVILTAEFDDFKEDITSLCYLEDLLVATGKDGTLKCYDIKQNRQTRNLLVSEFPISGCTKTSNRALFMFSTWDNTIITYNLDYGRITHSFEAHDDAITCLTMKNEFLVTGSWDCYVKIWKWLDHSTPNKRCILVDCLAVDDKVNHIDVRLKTSFIIVAIGLKNGDIVIWKYCTRQENSSSNHKIFEHNGQCDDLKFDSSGSNLASCGPIKGLVVLDTFTSMILFQRKIDDSIVCLNWLTSNFIFMGSQSGKIFVFDVKKGYVFHQFESHFVLIKYMLCIPNKYLIVAGKTQSNCIKVWTLKNFHQLDTYLTK